MVYNNQHLEKVLELVWVLVMPKEVVEVEY
jgi:hypothetical protein